MPKLKGALLALTFLFGISPLRAEIFSAEAVKAAFLYRFASYVEWPADAPASPFVIGIAGEDEVATQLEALVPRLTVRGKPVQVRRVNRVAQLEGVQILYIGPAAMARTRSLRRAAVERPILIVTDDAHGLQGGGVINFVDAGHNVRFEISLIAADRARLKIDSALLSVAARVERRPQAWRSCDIDCTPGMASMGRGGHR
ncbi:MAG TPA: YfiR family protein [Steroidobacteraceae bacterium]|nr:YfiR family protein [Steroidobacteraceae bacterium]